MQFLYRERRERDLAGPGAKGDGRPQAAPEGHGAEQEDSEDGLRERADRLTRFQRGADHVDVDGADDVGPGRDRPVRDGGDRGQLGSGRDADDLRGDVRAGQVEEEVFRSLGKNNDATRGTGCLESIWSQFRARFPPGQEPPSKAGKVSSAPRPAYRVFGQFFVGPGQLCAGTGFRKKVDLTVVTAPGRVQLLQFHELGHNEGRHDPDCPLSAEEKMLTQGCCEQEEPLDDEEEEGGDDEEDEADWKFRPRGGKNRETSLSDSMLERYCGFMNEVSLRAGHDFQMTFAAESQCQHFCGEGDLRKRLPKLLGEREVLMGFQPARLTESELLRKVLFDDEYHGVVLVRGGYETREDTASLIHGFTHCKRTRTDSVDPFTAALKAEEQGCSLEEAEKKLLRQGRSPLTVAARSVGGPERLMAVTVQYLRFLVRTRGFTGFRIEHLVRFHLRHWHFGILATALQQRYCLKREGGSGSLPERLRKIFINSAFGYLMINSVKFDKCGIAKLGSLRKRRFGEGRELKQFHVLGPCGEKEEDLLMYYSRNNQDSQINNLIQGAAQILGTSRLLFYAHLLYFAAMFDPGLVQGGYKDTDSSFLIHVFPRLEDNVRKRQRALYEVTKERIFACPDSLQTQAGKMEREATWDGGAVFRANKAYSVYNADGSRNNKLKGVARRLRDAMLPERDYDPQPGKEPVASYWRMGPTPSHDIDMSVISRKLVSGCNIKRRVHVSRRTQCLREA